MHTQKVWKILFTVRPWIIDETLYSTSNSLQNQKYLFAEQLFDYLFQNMQAGKTGALNWTHKLLMYLPIVST